MTVRIAVADDGDWELVRDVRLRALEEAPDAFGSTFEREAAFGREDWLDWIHGWEGAENRLFLAVDDAGAVGIAVGSRDRGTDLAHLYAMWVDPGVRGSGVGARLVEAVLDWAAGIGAATVELGVTEGNDAARRAYERAGFVDTGERHPLREASPLRVAILRRPVG